MAQAARARWVSVLVALALAAAACGGDDDDAGVETDDQGSAAAKAVFHYAGTVDEGDLVEAVKLRLSGFDVSGLAIEVVEPDTVTIEAEAADQATLDAAFEAVQHQGELRFRPVLSTIPGGVQGEPDAPPGLAPTPPERDLPDDPVVLTELDEDGKLLATYQLGPSALPGDVVESAEARADATGRWEIMVLITAEAIGQFNEVAGTCFSGGPLCPTSQLAIVLDSAVMSAPTLTQPRYERDEIVISGSFTRAEATTLATVLDTGALPVRLELESVAASDAG